MAAPSTTVFLPCYNVAPLLPACLHSLLAQPGANQLKGILVDDGVSLLRAGQCFGAVCRAACWNVHDARG